MHKVDRFVLVMGAVAAVSLAFLLLSSYGMLPGQCNSKFADQLKYCAKGGAK